MKYIGFQLYIMWLFHVILPVIVKIEIAISGWMSVQTFTEMFDS